MVAGWQTLASIIRIFVSCQVNPRLVLSKCQRNVRHCQTVREQQYLVCLLSQHLSIRVDHSQSFSISCLTAKSSQHQSWHLNLDAVSRSDVFLNCGKNISKKQDDKTFFHSYCQSGQEQQYLVWLSRCQQYQVCPEGSCFNVMPKNTRQDNNTTCVFFRVKFSTNNFGN